MGKNTRPESQSQYRFFPKDPRLGIFVFFILIVSAFIIRRTEGMVFLLIYVFFLHALSGASPGLVWNRSRKILLFAVLAIVLNAVLVEGEPLVVVGGRQIFSKNGLSRGLYYFLQILVLYQSMVLFISLTTREAFAKGISALIKPVAPKLAKRLALYAFLSMGFLPLFLEEFQRIATLQKFRGGGLEGGLIKRLRGVRLLLVPLILSAIHRSGQLAMVVELRDLKESAGELVSLGRPGLMDYLSIVTTLAVGGFAGFVYPWVFH